MPQAHICTSLVGSEEFEQNKIKKIASQLLNIHLYYLFKICFFFCIFLLSAMLPLCFCLRGKFGLFAIMHAIFVHPRWLFQVISVFDFIFVGVLFHFCWLVCVCGFKF